MNKYIEDNLVISSSRPPEDELLLEIPGSPVQESLGVPVEDLAESPVKENS